MRVLWNFRGDFTSLGRGFRTNIYFGIKPNIVSLFHTESLVYNVIRPLCRRLKRIQRRVKWYNFREKKKSTIIKTPSFFFNQDDSERIFFFLPEYNHLHIHSYKFKSIRPSLIVFGRSSKRFRIRLAREAYPKKYFVLLCNGRYCNNTLFERIYTRFVYYRNTRYRIYWKHFYKKFVSEARENRAKKKENNTQTLQKTAPTNSIVHFITRVR